MHLTYEDIQKLNKAAKAEYDSIIRQLQDTRFSPTLSQPAFFHSCHQSIMKADEIYRLHLADPLFANTDPGVLKQLYAHYYECFSPEGYESCVGNPDYSGKIMGKDLGALLAAIFMQVRALLSPLLRGSYHNVVSILKLYLQLLNQAQEAELEYDKVLAQYREWNIQNQEYQTALRLHRSFNPEADTYRSILEGANLDNLSYLYAYGIYIDDNEIAMAKHMASYDPQKLAELASFIVKSWIAGFERAKRDWSIKRYPRLIFPCGMERLARLVLGELSKLGMLPLVSAPNSLGINRQVGYDHRFDLALYWDQQHADRQLEYSEKFIQLLQDEVKDQAGPVVIELFGEAPFVPQTKDSALKLSPQQQEIFRNFNARYGQLMHQYYRRDETSFTIIAFPSPQIGDNFEAIFDDILKINLLDSDKYARIQQHIIDVLDTAAYVHVKGRTGNDTDIKVKMHTLEDPATQTLFENCVADVNIPVGEVFTSPVLEGTTGVLHVEDIYLNDLRFLDLRIRFEDGWVADYSCSNFPDAAEGKKYIHENLLLPHDSLPIGEFAIGTNTLAYQIARKYDIQALLPILIIEKMGPHFAIGDTCYSHEEEADHTSFFNGKEMIAVDNEKSILRKTDPINAYTNKHLDITLPYDMLQNITAVTPEGKRVDIIRNGRFVVKGTEELNIPLEEA